MESANLLFTKPESKMMYQNQSSKYGIIEKALFIPLILLFLVLSNAYAQDIPKKDTVKQDVPIHHVDNKSLPVQCC